MPIDIIRPEWPAPARVRALCTGRRGGVSRDAWASLNLGMRSGDDPAAVSANRRSLVTALQLPSEPAWLNQVHGMQVMALPLPGPEPVADASYAISPGLVCVVLTADCLPVLFCDEAATVVAAAHAGWRGLAGGVIEATVASMPVPPQRLMAWLGPAIGPEAFEVGSDVHAAFVSHDAQAAVAFRPGGREGHWHADLFQLARQRLAALGVTQVFGGGVSTHADAQRFFSHRRDRVTGRQAALIWIEP